jgi:hypothetical protein
MKLSIGDRITISKKDQETIIKILGKTEVWMNHALLGWLLMWTVIGVYVIYYILSSDPSTEQMFFFITYVIFWIYFEIKVIYSWLFKSYGFELIKITPNEWYVKRSVFSYGKVRRYVKENIKDIRMVKTERKSINDSLNKSFWIVGNEQIAFDYIGKNIGIGIHLTPKEQSELLMQLRKIMKKK